jgi:hypothetical protein
VRRGLRNYQPEFSSWVSSGHRPACVRGTHACPIFALRASRGLRMNGAATHPIGAPIVPASSAIAHPGGQRVTRAASGVADAKASLDPNGRDPVAVASPVRQDGGMLRGTAFDLPFVEQARPAGSPHPGQCYPRRTRQVVGSTSPDNAGWICVRNGVNQGEQPSDDAARGETDVLRRTGTWPHPGAHRDPCPKFPECPRMHAVRLPRVRRRRTCSGAVWRPCEFPRSGHEAAVGARTPAAMRCR